MIYKQEPYLVSNPHCGEPIVCACGSEFFSLKGFNDHCEDCKDWLVYKSMYTPVWGVAFTGFVYEQQ